MKMTQLCVFIPPFYRTVQKEKLVQSRHRTNNLLQSACPNKFLLACHGGVYAEGNLSSALYNNLHLGST